MSSEGLCNCTTATAMCVCIILIVSSIVSLLAGRWISLSSRCHSGSGRRRTTRILVVSLLLVPSPGLGQEPTNLELENGVRLTFFDSSSPHCGAYVTDSGIQYPRGTYCTDADREIVGGHAYEQFLASL